MQTLTFTKGLPGSGKSTWSKQYCEKHLDTVRVCRDDLRHMRGKYWNPKAEGLITVLEHKCIEAALQNGYNVIVDATNLKDSYVNAIKKLALETISECQFKVQDFTNISLKECIKRDSLRPNSVGAEVIKNFYYKYIVPKVEVINNPELPHAIICDLDGTLAIHDGRSPYEYDKCDTDLVNQKIVDIIDLYTAPQYSRNYHILFVSGRKDYCKEKTLNWLNKIWEDYFNKPEFELYMRKSDDDRADFIVKKEIFMEHINGKYFIEFVLDDRNQVVDMWRRELGLTCLQVNEGDF